MKLAQAAYAKLSRIARGSSERLSEEEASAALDNWDELIMNAKTIRDEGLVQLATIRRMETWLVQNEKPADGLPRYARR